MAKFDILREKQTNGINYGRSNDDVITTLEQWDSLYGATVTNAEHDSVNVKFDRLPDDIHQFAAEVYEFCPDTVDQGTGLYDADYAADVDPEDEPELAALLDGIDFSSPKYGLEILARSIESTQSVCLWWD